MHLLKSKSGALSKDPRGSRNSQGCRSGESFCPPSFPPQTPAPRHLRAANSPSAKLPSSRREMVNLGASPLQPPPRRARARLTCPQSHGSEVCAGGSTAPPALAPETSPPRAQTLQKLDPNSQPAPSEPPREPGEAGPRTTKQRGVGNLESREAWRARSSKKRRAPQAGPSTSPSPGRR